MNSLTVYSIEMTHYPSHNSQRNSRERDSRKPVTMGDFRKVMSETIITPEQLERIHVRADGIIDLSDSGIGELR